MGNVRELSFEIVVVGGGPAGIAAAVAAAECDKRVALVDDNAWPGGQIWRGGTSGPSSPEAKRWLELLAKSQVQVIGGARVFRAEKSTLEAESDEVLWHVGFERLILATGARELFLPFPGWTLPNVMGAGGLQALVKSGLPIAGKRVVLAGTGPLLLAVAAYLSDHGAKVLCICEQAPLRKLAGFGLRVLGFPKKAWEAVTLRSKCFGAKYLMASWPVEAKGKEVLEAVSICEKGRIRDVECDYLGCGYHLVPNTELAQMLKCRVRDGFVETDELQETSRANVFCAGEPTGIGGMEFSIIEGRIAGYAAGNRRQAAAKLFTERARYRKVADAMKKAFALRPELAALTKPETLVCRCEDVSFERMRKYDSWKAAKLHSRCGMGPCQGRVCGAAASFLFGWNVEAPRPPVFPVRCESLAAVASFGRMRESDGGRI